MDILSSQASVADLQGLFTSPTPLTSILCGLLTLIAAAAVYAAFHPLRDQKPNKESGESGWDKFIVWSRKVDHDIVDNWPYVTGTHYPSRRATAQHRLAPRRSAIDDPTTLDRIGPALELSRVGYVSPASPGVGRRINQLIGHTCLSTTQIDEANDDGRYR